MQRRLAITALVHKVNSDVPATTTHRDRRRCGCQGNLWSCQLNKIFIRLLYKIYRQKVKRLSFYFVCMCNNTFLIAKILYVQETAKYSKRREVSQDPQTPWWPPTVTQTLPGMTTVLYIVMIKLRQPWTWWLQPSCNYHITKIIDILAPPPL